MANRKRLVAVAAVLTLVGVGLWWHARADADKDPSRIAANGTVEADETELGAQRAARLVRYNVEEGQSVKKGQVVAVLDTSELSAQLQQAEGSAGLAAARLAELQRGSRAEEIQRAAAQLAQARANVGGAQRTVANAKKGYTRRTTLREGLDAAETQRKVALAAVQQAESAQAGAEEALKTAQQEHDTSIQLRTARDAARQQLEAGQALAANATAKLQELLNGTRPEQLRQAEAQVGQATAAVASAREEMNNAASDLTRAKELHAGRAISDQQLDTVQTRADKSKAALAQAEQSRSQAEQRLSELRSGARKEEIDAAQAALAQAQANVEGGRKALENAQQAYELRLGAQAQLVTARTQRLVTQAQVASAKSNLSGAELAVRNARTAFGDALQEKQGVDTALQQYEAGIAQLQAADAQLAELKNGATPEQLEQARAQVKQARGALQLAKVQYEQSVIKAPRDGVITKHVALVGEVVTVGATVAKLVPLDEVYLTLYVPLPQLGKVKLGQAVDVTADTFPGRAYHGTVYLISDTPEFTPRNVQTQDERVKLVFQVKVRVQNANRDLKPGMPADAHIALR